MKSAIPRRVVGIKDYVSCGGSDTSCFGGGSAGG
jgi:hypothetical protein